MVEVKEWTLCLQNKRNGRMDPTVLSVYSVAVSIVVGSGDKE